MGRPYPDWYGDSAIEDRYDISIESTIYIHIDFDEQSAHYLDTTII